MYKSCFAVNVVVPEKVPDVADGTPVKGTSTLAVCAGSAGPWMWPAVAFDVRLVLSQ